MKQILTLTLAFLCISFLSAQKASENLKTIIQEIDDHKSYDREEFPLGLFTENYYKEESEFAEKQLKQLQEIKSDSLSETEQISLEMLKFKLQETIDHYEYEAYLNPLLSDSGFHLSLAYQVRDLNNYAQVKAYLNKLNAIPTYVDQHFALLREGLQKGNTQPRIIFEGYESTYNDQIVEDPKESYFYEPFENLPGILSEAQKDSVLTAAENAIANNVIPQFIRIKEFFETEYLPGTRTSLGVSEIPNGREYYQNRLDYYTTLDLSAEEIHQIGLEEVARINSEMKKIIAEVEFDGSFEEFIHYLRTDEQFYAKTGKELLKEARDIAKRIDAKLPAYFKTLPRKPYGVTKVPDAIAPKYTTGRYIGASNETQPGYYWVNTYNLSNRPLYVLPSLTAHEAVPGHHLQNALNAELGDSIPKFRRNMYLSAYGEGWGLYSEFLAEDMGIYTTPYELFGKLTYEQWRACRLVIDTGIHAMGWSREEAVAYFEKNTALSMHNINTEVDRYISWPGQAVSYKIGEIKIRELRKKAEEALGSDFNIRDFHEVILEQGVVTLPILEERVNAFIESNND
ncbi:DUF885 domain-containing protein [Salegentibacter salarius]|uniref:DUF885 domain-containing protein n=1 Tax=Salegentibacter salarius TaxID=435906 RepID=A0A2N0TQB0_9FLAO|nr:DUF885 domain-containing protein [Salegentibacter salarius]OEY71680.1 hypothetical protein BHS39_04780 [Salegentibacter salarius]PKD16929.1 hypothetical protein APR40_04780 [Salegentibacter salarius]SLJ90705.1 Uncharacterized conserved protein, DUF885 familyt [Salegentibacter salarius]